MNEDLYCKAVEEAGEEMKVKAEEVERIDFTNGDCVSRSGNIWVGSCGNYTTTYDTLTEYLEDRRNGAAEKFEIARRQFLRSNLDNGLEKMENG